MDSVIPGLTKKIHIDLKFEALKFERLNDTKMLPVFTSLVF